MERPQDGATATEDGAHGPDYLEALRAVIQELGRGADSGRMMEVVLDRVLRVVRGKCGVIYTWDATAGALVPRAWRGVARRIAGQRLKSGEGVAGAVAEHGEGLIVNDVPGSRFAETVDCQEATPHAILAEPLGHRDRLLGVLVVGRKRPADPFGDADREAARLFATPVSLALEQARLVEELEAELHERQQAEADLLRWRRQVEAVSEIGDEVAREMDVSALLQLIATRVMVLLDAAGSALYLSEDEEQALVAKSAEGLLRPVLLERRRFGQGIVGTTAQSRQGIIANDYPHSAYLVPSVLESARVEAAMTEPLLFRGRLLGVVHVVRDALGGAFTAEDQYTLRLVAKQTCLAIEHARLFADLNEAFAQLQVLQDEVVRTERLQTLGQLTSGTVFNLMNCLSIIVGQVEQLGLRLQDPRIQESLTTMANAAMGAVGMVRRLEAFTAEKPGGGMEPCDLAGLVMEAASTTQPRWKDEAEREGRQIRVEVQIPELPAVVGRPGDLREVVTKLILHALEASLSAAALIEHTADPFDQVSLRQRRALLATLIDQLPVAERTVLSLYYHEELTMKEIAAVLEVTEARVSQIHTAAITRLRGRLRRRRLETDDLRIESRRPRAAPFQRTHLAQAARCW